MEINKENIIATAGDVLRHLGFLIVQQLDGPPKPVGKPANIQYHTTPETDYPDLVA